jgi:inosine-uridine nucleoside N-ribohydrolase
LEPAVDVHGERGLDGPELPEPDVPLDERPATALIGGVLAGAGEPVTIFATGPLTNIAAALEHVERERIREIVWMGGSTERGNRTPYAEFNAWVDPVAAQSELDSGVEQLGR